VNVYEAPAKLNLSLHVDPPRSDGYHPVQSMVQTIDWLDILEVAEGEGKDSLLVSGIEVPVDGNLILKAIEGVRRHGRVRPLDVSLQKTIPLGAGLGGGSSDAAAAILGAIEIEGLTGSLARSVAAGVGADVSLFLTGGTLMMTGVGEEIESIRSLEDVAFAVVVPEFGLSTVDVYRKWDVLEGPTAEPVPEPALPPSLRGGMPVRNDLTPAAIELEPRMGDFMADLSDMWGTSISMTGSGSACFGYFGSLDEAEDAARAASSICSTTMGVMPRTLGVRKVERVQ
jgi:4-diphosphocytidyl-2-C-methyl-D-erythritol kinase